MMLMRIKMLNPIQWLLSICCVVLLSNCVSVETVPPASPNETLVKQIEEIGLVAKETERGVVIYLPSVTFGFESADLSDSTKSKVRYIAQIFNKNIIQDRNILVEGHTDAIGPEKYNMKLSRKRAIAVTNLLKHYAVKADRIGQAWFGETRPLVPNKLSSGADNAEGRSVNRRVEFIVLNRSN